MTQYCVDKDGNYIGGFDGADLPIGSIAIDAPPEHGCDILDTRTGIWDTSKRPAPPLGKAARRAKIEAANSIAQLKQVLIEELGL